MNTLEPYNLMSPDGVEEDCGKFTIDELLSPFVLHDIVEVGKSYVFSLWIKSDNPGSIVINGTTIETDAEWSERYEVVFKANTPDVYIYFNTEDNYYFYHAQLELGIKATDWAENPLDVNDRIIYATELADDSLNIATETKDRVAATEATLAVLNDMIATLVTDGEGGSLMTQTADGGWTFNMGQTDALLDSIKESIDKLDSSLNVNTAGIEALNKSIDNIKENGLDWVKVTTFEGEPCIALGEAENDFQLLITNTRILFVEGSSVPAYITNKALNITKAVIKEEMQLGNFVWQVRSNGHLSFVYKGGA